MEKIIGMSDFCQLLSMGFKVPTMELIEGILDKTYLDDTYACLVEAGADASELDEIFANILADIDGKSADDIYHMMKIEYTRLFLVPKKEEIQIYEVLFCFDGEGTKPSMFIAPSTMHLEKMMKDAGVEYIDKKKYPCDHISVEMEFMAYILSKVIAGKVNNDEVATADALALLAEFKDKHFNRFFAPFMNAVVEKSGEGLYVSLAKLGLIFAKLIEEVE